jgi:hypothetical protein
VKGVSGNALKFDGFTTAIHRPTWQEPARTGEITVEAWIALHSYPWNWVAIADQETDHGDGYYFGIDAEGRLGLQVSVWNTWQVCTSDVKLPLMTWVHVVGSYNREKGISLYVDGRQAGQLRVSGALTIGRDTPFQIGRNLRDLPPTGLVRQKASVPALYSFDGLIDELRIYNRPLSASEVLQRLHAFAHPGDPSLSNRKWPTLPKSGRFGAVYCSLKLYPEWDALWRSGDYPDVVVSFEKSPVDYVFWRGANFIENLVTENGLWIGDQSYESSTPTGTAEHMNDKHALHQYIRIVENTPARVVLHWRYGLVDVKGQFSHVDPLSGWGDWADEYFYIYPDGISVRYGIIHGTAHHYSFAEPTLLLEPGKKAEDEISLNAVTIANAKGDSKTYSWDPVSPVFPFPDQPAQANIAMLNTKSTYKPFYIYQPGTELGPYGWPPELRPEYSHFPTWDHWPVNQIPSDGRFELYPDHFASAAIMSPELPEVKDPAPDRARAKMFLFGMTDQSISSLPPISQSWLNPPRVTLEGAGYELRGYDPAQRGYVITRSGSKATPLWLHIAASRESPVYNPVLLIQNWGDSPPTITMGEKQLDSDAYRIGYVRKLEGTDLMLWLRISAATPVTIGITQGEIHR